jgi:hypothetical protein
MVDIEDPAARQRVADEIFGGTGGEQLIELLALGADGYRALGEEAERAGAVITDDQNRLARELKQSQIRLGEVFSGMRNSLATEFMPFITFAFGALADTLIDNREEVVAWAANFADGVESFLPYVGEVVEGMGNVAGVIGDVVSSAAELAGGFDNLTEAAGIFFGARFIGAVFASTPLGIAIGAAGAAVLLIANNWDAVKERTQAVFDWMGGKLDWLLEKIRPVTDALGFVISEGAKALNAIGITPGSGSSAGRLEDRAPPVIGDGAAPVVSTGSGSRVQARAKGGAFRPGAVLVGEEGPELRYESRGGYIADAEATRGILGGGGRTVVNNLTVNVSTKERSIREIAQELARETGQATRRALYDPMTGGAQYE